MTTVRSSRIVCLALTVSVAVGAVDVSGTCGRARSIDDATLRDADTDSSQWLNTGRTALHHKRLKRGVCHRRAKGHSALAPRSAGPKERWQVGLL